MFFVIENEVLLFTKNLFMWRSFHKLEDKFREFFKIINIYNKQQYTLKFLKTMKKNSFYISHLIIKSLLSAEQQSDKVKIKQSYHNE